MRMNRYSYMAAGTLLAAVASWCLAGYLAWDIASQRAARETTAIDLQQESVQEAAGIRLHALVQATETQRNLLATAADVSIVEAANAIEEAGAGLGIDMRLSGALPEGGSAASDGPSVQPVGFVVGADGSFARLMQALRLFETLPFPSEVERFDIERVPGSEGLWHLNIYLRVLTAATAATL